jgi:putative peptide zinc metalloprotease protein
VGRCRVRCAPCAARFGGPVKTAQNKDDLTPTPALFHVLVQLEAPPPVLRETRADVHIEGDRRSLLLEGVTHLLAVLVRESGF